MPPFLSPARRVFWRPYNLLMKHMCCKREPPPPPPPELDPRDKPAAAVKSVGTQQPAPAFSPVRTLLGLQVRRQLPVGVLVPLSAGSSCLH